MRDDPGLQSEARICPQDGRAPRRAHQGRGPGSGRFARRDL